jgi:hypothetical protein
MDDVPGIGYPQTRGRRFQLDNECATTPTMTAMAIDVRIRNRRIRDRIPRHNNNYVRVFLPSRFRKANSRWQTNVAAVTVKPQTYQPNTFLRVLFGISRTAAVCWSAVLERLILIRATVRRERVAPARLSGSARRPCRAYSARVLSGLSLTKAFPSGRLPVPRGVSDACSPRGQAKRQTCKHGGPDISP